MAVERPNVQNFPEVRKLASRYQQPESHPFGGVTIKPLSSEFGNDAVALTPSVDPKTIQDGNTTPQVENYSSADIFGVGLAPGANQHEVLLTLTEGIGLHLGGPIKQDYQDQRLLS